MGQQRQTTIVELFRQLSKQHTFKLATKVSPAPFFKREGAEDEINVPIALSAFRDNRAAAVDSDTYIDKTHDAFSFTPSQPRRVMSRRNN